jgi:hypothetical protein
MMRKKMCMVEVILPSIGIAALILDSSTALAAAADGVELCLRTVIPTLFPFFFLSIILTNIIGGRNISLLRPLGKFCNLPLGAESLFLIGLLGGYPTGAQAVTECYQRGQLSKVCAKRLLGFCNNAGPAFIFRIMGSLFDSQLIPWQLWAIHILSAAITGSLIPENHKSNFTNIENNQICIQSAFKKALLAIASVCGWIILFRVLIAFLQRWLLWFLPKTMSIAIIGLLELANGSFELQKIDNESLRFILSSVFLSFGGLCVGMQTISVTADIGACWYFPGKIIQCVLSFTMATIVSFFLLDPLPYHQPMLLFGILVTIWMVFSFRQNKITVAFFRKWVYNTQKQTRELR